MIWSGLTKREEPLEDKPYNLNISAFRLLYLYKLLSQKTFGSYADLNRALTEHPLIARSVSQETLTKYLNTLRMLGCQIEKRDYDGKPLFHLETHPCKMHVSEEERLALFNAISHLMQQPLLTRVKQWVYLLQKICDIPDWENFVEGLFQQTEFHHGLLPEELQRLECFEKYCQEGQLLEIRYIDNNQDLLTRHIEPKEVILSKRRLFLMGYDPKFSTKMRFELDKIQSHRQLPNRIRSQVVKSTITFKLYDKMAKQYIPYPGETLLDKGEFLLVKHVTDELQPLLQRLLKYGPLCEVISPPNARKEMSQLITQLLETV